MLLRHINYLLAVAKHQNFTRAAEALHVSQPTLSQQIKQLEESLGVQLLDRSGRNVRLTDAGDAYLCYARRALQDLDAGKRAIHDVQDLSRGSLRLALTPTFIPYLIGPLLEAFHARYPAISLSILEMTQDRIEMALADDHIDVGVAFTAATSLIEFSLSEIERKALYVENLVAVVGQTHPLAGKSAKLTSAAFEREALALLSRDFATRQHIDRYFREQNIRPNIAVEANSIGAIVEITRRSKLATILPETVTREQYKLFPVTLRPALPHRTVALLSRRGAYQNAACQAFADLISDWAKKGVFI